MRERVSERESERMRVRENVRVRENKKEGEFQRNESKMYGTMKKERMPF
jgi:hypothetical protein